MAPVVHAIFSKTTRTWQYVVADPETRRSVIIDCVRDDKSSGDVSMEAADLVLNTIKEHDYLVDYVLDTKSGDARTLSAAWYLRMQLGDRQAWYPELCNDSVVSNMQRVSQRKYGPNFRISSHSTQNAADGDIKHFGKLQLVTLRLPGKSTPDRRAFLIGDCLFGGHSLAAWRENGSHAIDVAGTDDRVSEQYWQRAWNSMSKIFQLSDETRAYLDQSDPREYRHPPYETLRACRSVNGCLGLTASELFLRRDG